MIFVLPCAAQDTAPQQPAAIVVHRSPASGLPVPIGFFSGEPPDIVLIPRGEGARGGRLWIRTGFNGIYIAGTVDGGQPDFPHTRDQLLSKDHVEVWLAASPGMDLPEIGWGHQFGEETLPKGEDSCTDWAKNTTDTRVAPDSEKKCRDWAAAQVRYRPFFGHLFLRQWLLSPDYATESYATPAYEEIQRRFSGLGDKIPEFMKPRGKPQMFLFPDQSGYSFEIMIPFDAFPPLPSLRPSDLYLLVDVFQAAPPGKKTGVYSTSSPARVYGKAATFNTLRLDPPLFFQLTPCELPLVGTDKRGGYHPAWFIPHPGFGPQDQSDTFIIINDPAGYRYEPAGLSPTVRPTHYFWQSPGPNEWVCGPHLTYKKAGQSESYTYTISDDGFEIKRHTDGSLLIKTGPRIWYSEFGSGQCGGCPRTDLRIFHLRADRKVFGALGLGDVINTPGLFSQDFTVSPDWSQITEYDLKGNEQNLPGSWSSTTWCLKPNSQRYQAETYVYEKCGEKGNVQPPNPPVLKGLRDWER